MVFIVVFLNEGPLEKQHLLKGYPSQIYQIKSKSNQDLREREKLSRVQPASRVPCPKITKTESFSIVLMRL